MCMYNNVGPQWASSFPPFLASGFAPYPSLVLKFGPALRVESKFANAAKVQMDRLLNARKRIEEKFEEKHGIDVQRPAGTTGETNVW
ncbi:hypothetical protein B0A50_01273 [Salinomyces thailandicus]|uniref:Uncharacterized protein n=1 Tax=Salinomyces thailandicus TaxID=706561 RepID=A0A4U0UA69_9PEZI|nr:hypothetical protein B0A50_01273 [Salinomyces thailandica]